jgi:hypothetical protein
VRVFFGFSARFPGTLDVKKGVELVRKADSSRNILYSGQLSE